jgi:hypothetical protein
VARDEAWCDFERFRFRGEEEAGGSVEVARLETRPLLAEMGSAKSGMVVESCGRYQKRCLNFLSDSDEGFRGVLCLAPCNWVFYML